MMNAHLQIRALQKTYAGVSAVRELSIDVGRGELLAFVGPSGCGKTTTLRMIAGFIEPTSGRIEIGGRDVTDTPPHRRNTGMVFQRYGLFPHMDVAGNASFGLEMRGVPKSERSARVKRALDLVRLSGFEHRYAKQLSGGQQQRVALARALVIEPDLFLLDEPLSNLDANLRVQVRDEIKVLQKRLGLTTVFVTHDQEEALAIADRVAIMRDGRLEQVGTPEEVYGRPANPFVAAFLGKTNFLHGRCETPGRFVSERGTQIAIQGGWQGPATLGIRPERVELLANPVEGSNCLQVRIRSTVFGGSTREVLTATSTSDELSCTVQNRSSGMLAGIEMGTPVYAKFDASDCFLFRKGQESGGSEG